MDRWRAKRSASTQPVDHNFGDRIVVERVGRTRLTGVGMVAVAVLALVAVNPPAGVDRTALVVIWCSGLVAALIGVIWPTVAVRRVRLAASSPRDALVGDTVPITLQVTSRSGGFEARCLDPSGPWHRMTGPGWGELPHLVDKRGCFDLIRIELRATAPLGFVSAGRVVWCELPTTIEAGPRPLNSSWRPSRAPVEAGVGAATSSSPSGDLVRSVRPYVNGDPPNRVHWPSTARLGQLVVRELEPPSPVGQAIVVDLRDLGDQTEPAASYAMGACLAVLEAGGRLVLCTFDRTGPVSEPVRFPIDASRRLARALPGPPGSPPEGWPVLEIGR